MKTIVLISILISQICTSGQSINIGPNPTGYFADYARLVIDNSQKWFLRIKHKRISKSHNLSVSFSTDYRLQYFHVINENWGDSPKDDDGYALTRILTHADIHVGNRFRSFTQIQSSLANSKNSTSPVDDNPLEVHQLFFDWMIDTSIIRKLTLRIGRQEFLYGSQRLVSVRDGPNNRQSFDGVKLIMLLKNTKTDVFYSNYVVARKNIFDDQVLNNNNRFWGLYLVQTKVPVVHNIDLYYLGQNRQSASFDDGKGEENRHSIGARIWNTNKVWNYDGEALFQFGSFSGKDIKAWTTSLNISYRFTGIKFTPQLGIKAELISGDKTYGDQQLQTFNPLYPRGAYFGLAALIGPVNLVDYHPYLNISFSKKTELQVDYDIFRRYSRNDGLYGPNVVLLYSGNGIIEKSIGAQLSGSIIYKPSTSLYLRPEFTWFNAGAFLKKAGSGKDIYFAGLTAQLKI